jgi:hypothetical protein
VFVCSYIILHRIFDAIKDESFCFNAWTAHRSMLVAFCLAAKSLDDTIPAKFNLELAEAGGIPLKDLNRRECRVLALLNWRVHVTRACFWETHDALVGSSLTAKPHEGHSD